ncbi:MAG: type VI secretion system baseplate subunit TssE [Pseudomonadota bacterium]
MAENKSTIELSLFDRLRDEDGTSLPGGAEPRAGVIDQVREALRRDIEALLNARRRFLIPSSTLCDVQESILMYGVPDFSNEGYSTKEHRHKLRLEIEKTLAQYEPRLGGVVVELSESGTTGEGPIHFRISARARITSEYEPVYFDTAVEPVDWSVRVKEGD